MAALMEKHYLRKSCRNFPNTLPMKLTAIIVAAGNSRRMGFDKLLTPLSGKPVLQHSIEAFLDCTDVDELILVCPRQVGRQRIDETSERIGHA